MSDRDEAVVEVWVFWQNVNPFVSSGAFLILSAVILILNVYYRKTSAPIVRLGLYCVSLGSGTSGLHELAVFYDWSSRPFLHVVMVLGFGFAFALIVGHGYLYGSAKLRSRLRQDLLGLIITIGALIALCIVVRLARP